MFLRLGVKWMLLAGMAAWVARYGLFSFAADSKTQWMIIGGVILHGICYDFFFVTGQIYVDRTAPAAIRGQAQGLLVLITQGLGLGIGAQVVAKIVASNTEGAVVNWHMVWLIPCLAALAILVVFAVFFKDTTSSDQATLEKGIADTPPATGPVEPAPVP
jgi:MFS family permease